MLTGGTAFVTSHYGYDGMGRLTSLDHKNSSSTSITGYGWTYDAASRMKSMDFTNSTYLAEDVSEFKYDRTDQLLTGDRTGTTNDEAYGYDGTGNRTAANGATYTTTSNNRLTNDGTFTYTYDDEGNRLTRVRISGAAADDKTVEYTWDYRNRLEKVTFKRNDATVTKTVDLVYDFANRLTRKDVDPDGALGSATIQTDHYLWDGDELVGITGYSSLVFASGPAPDMVLFESATTLHALLGDHQNTVRDVISTSGTVENHLVYNSYGDLKSQTGGGAYSPFHRFTGKPFDTAVGLQYNLHRWYDPAVGRWVSEDPIGFGGRHPNLSAYAGNSPTSGVDSMGLAPVEPLPGPVVPTWVSRGDGPIVVFGDAEYGPFSLGGILSPNGLDLRPDIDIPSILQNFADFGEFGPPKGQVGLLGEFGGIVIGNSELEAVFQLGEHGDIRFSDAESGLTVEAELRWPNVGASVLYDEAGVNVQGHYELPYGGVTFGYNPASGANVAGYIAGPYGTITGIYGDQGGGLTYTWPVDFGAWSGHGSFTIQTGSGSLFGPGWLDPNPDDSITLPGSGVQIQIIIQPRPRRF